MTPEEREQYRKALMAPGDRLQRLAYWMLAVGVIAILATAVTLILRT